MIHGPHRRELNWSALYLNRVPYLGSTAPTMSVYLGIDIGTSGTKTLAINAKGKILAQAMAAYPCYHPKPLWSEQDPDDWWQATVKTVRAVVQAGQAQAGRRARRSASRARCTARCSSTSRGRSSAGPCCGTTSGPRPSARKSNSGPAARKQLIKHGRQPGADRLHRAEDPLAAEPRAEEFRQGRQGAAAQGRRSAAG